MDCYAAQAGSAKRSPSGNNRRLAANSWLDRLRLFQIRWLPIFAVVLFGLTAGCDDAPPFPNSTLPAPEIVQEIFQTEAAPISASRVAETLALGGKFTDLQREQLLKELIGSVVQWQIRVYDISLDGSVYKVTTQPFAISDPEALSILRATILVVPRSDGDRTALVSARTDDILTIKGKVQDVAFRGVMTISPAILLGSV